MANSKKETYGDAAEQLFVQHGETRDQIAARFRLSDKTVRSWAKEGRWEEKRALFLERKATTIEDLEFVVQKVARSARMDIEAGKAVSDQRLYALQKLAETLEKMQKFSKARAAAEQERPSDPLSPEQLAEQVDEILGLRR